MFVDAPCSGSGAWRRSPDAKWRMRPGALEQRIKDQIEILESAARFVKPGGRIVYVTCSVLKAENEDRVTAFLETHADFLPLDAAHMARSAGLAGVGRTRLDARAQGCGSARCGPRPTASMSLRLSARVSPSLPGELRYDKSGDPLRRAPTETP